MLKCLLLTTYIETILCLNDLISLYFIENNIIYMIYSVPHTIHVIYLLLFNK